MRDTQRQIDELGKTLDRFADESREADRRLGERLEQLAEQTDRKINQLVDQDRRLGERIDALVSAIGALAQIKR